MIKIQITGGKVCHRYLLICLVALLLFQNKSFAQKNDYIVIQKTTYTEGKIKDLPSDGNTSVYFRRVSREEFKKYTIDEIDELMVNQRKFFKKQINIGKGIEEVYLELIPQEFEQLKLWSLNQDNPEYFIEKEGELIHLNESYKEILSEQLSNPQLASLIDITKLHWFDLTYLLNSAKRYKAPRTYTRLLGFTPYAGINFVENKFPLPFSRQEVVVSGAGFTLGFNAEIFLNFKRNISLNFSPNWNTFNNKEFLNYNSGDVEYDTDVAIEYSCFQLPIIAKFYFDISPNKWRAYIEGGYVFSKNDYKKVDMFTGEKDGNSITTTQKNIALKNRFYGYEFGIGIIKYFEKDKGILFGIRNTQMKASESESISSTSAFIGYKF